MAPMVAEATVCGAMAVAIGCTHGTARGRGCAFGGATLASAVTALTLMAATGDHLIVTGGVGAHVAAVALLHTAVLIAVWSGAWQRVRNALGRRQSTVPLPL